MWLNKGIKTFFFRSWVPLTITLVLEFIIFEFIGRQKAQPGFASFPTVILILNQLSIFGIMAIGMTFVIMAGGIDLSIGSLGAMSGVISALVAVYISSISLHFVPIAFLLGPTLGIFVGIIMGSIITFLNIQPFIVTLAFMSLLRGLANIITNGKPISPVPDNFLMLGRGMCLQIIPISVVIFGLIFFLGLIILHYTSLGRHTLAIGGNEESARLSGVPIQKVKLSIYILCSALSALAGVILASRMGSGSPKVGIGDELAVIASVVIGGTSLSGGKGSLWGTLLGLCVVFTLNSGLNWIGIETFGQQVTLGLVILTAVLIDKIQGKLKEQQPK
ncbi:MAG TPA: ABC transporter permease [Candidatus Hydrogenedens sp.]|nr:ABC transporter permease [Candidatus Hydrogenedens sp.]HOL19088.1 ABC transporter permease [Candidatus Hydrogenedens sp.]HPP58094.1 ABC transporter permease [Candidatus Hydrogenedens sp.]